MDKKAEIVRAAEKLFDKEDDISFLLVGRTGVGKSSTINSLLGKKVAPIGKYKPKTLQVKKYKHKHGNIKYSIYDTPGLCDELPEAGNDQNYLDQIKENIKDVDSIWFITKLDDSRVSQDEKRGIKLISEALGSERWKNSIIVFTRADKSDDFEKDLKQRTSVIRKEIGLYYKGARRIPAIAVSNTQELLPNGKPWLPELFTQVFISFRDSSALPFLKSMESDIGAKQSKKPSDTPPRISLNEEQKSKIKDSMLKRISAGATLGAGIGQKIGKTFGPIGEAIGVGLGALAGGLLGFFFS